MTTGHGSAVSRRCRMTSAPYGLHVSHCKRARSADIDFGECGLGAGKLTCSEAQLRALAYPMNHPSVRTQKTGLAARVTVRPHTTTPPVDTSSEGAEARAEGDFRPTTGVLTVHSWEDGSIDELPNLAATDPGLYRLRLTAQGRQIDTSGPEDPVVESYLLQIWPLPGQI